MENPNPDPTAGRRRRSSPPLYQLYGETPSASALDGLHLESIASRNRLHNWEIQPHRHAHLVQLLLMRQGTLGVHMDAQTLTLGGPALVWVPALAVHGFQTSEDTVGIVLTLEQARLRMLLAGAPDLMESLGVPRVERLDGENAPLARSLFAVAEQLHEDYFGAPPWRTQALDHAVGLIATQVARLRPLAPDTPHSPQTPHLQAPEEGRGLQHLARYREQVERHYRQQPGIAELAAPLGITTTQLNRLCRKHLGCSALAVLHHRLLLEAQRELGYTHLQIRQISDGLGFSDAAYFTRFFIKATGLSPSDWRVRHSGG